MIVVDAAQISHRFHGHLIRLVCTVTPPTLIVMLVSWALTAGLTCCFLMQRLTDNAAAQKLPSSGLNPETAQGETLQTVMSVSFQLYPVCITHTHTHSLSLSHTRTHTEMKCVNLTLGLVFIRCQFCGTATLLHAGVLHFKLTTNPRVSDSVESTCPSRKHQLLLLLTRPSHPDAAS